VDGRVDEGVAVDLAEALEVGALEAGDHAQHPLLLAPLHARLEAHQVQLALRQVLLAELDDGVGPPAVGAVEAHRLHGAVAQGVLAAARQLLDGQAPLEEDRPLELVRDDDLGLGDGALERQVLLAVERCVQVVLAATLAVARLPEEPREVEALGVDDRRDGVIEVEVLAPQEPLEGGGHGGRGERAGREDGLAGRDLGHLLPPDLDAGQALERRRDLAREALAVEGEGAPRRHRGAARRRDDERPELLHLALQEPGGVVGIVAAQRVAAHQLGEVARLVRRGRTDGPHLMEDDGHAAPRQLVGALRAREPGADDVDGVRDWVRDWVRIGRDHAVHYRERGNRMAR